MVWMQNLMRRSRQSQSPSDPSPKSQRSFFGSKNKRKSWRKDSGMTDIDNSFSSSGASDSAAWRVENLRPGAPKAMEWWQEDDTALESSFETNSDDSSSGTEERLETFLTKSEPSARAFHNCGMETWLRAREEWKKRTVAVLKPRPTPAEYNQLVRGLKKHSTLRNYELPRQMALSDLIDVYTDIWEGGV